MEKEPINHYEVKVISPDKIRELRQLQCESWRATYLNEEAGVEKEWVKERTESWFTPDAINKSREFLETVLQDPNQFHRTVERDGKIVGFVHASRKDEDNYELNAIYTSPSVFGKGIGSQLMEEANEWIGNHTVELDVADYNQRAIKFYQKHGFYTIPGSESMYADKIPTIKMRREANK